MTQRKANGDPAIEFTVPIHATYGGPVNGRLHHVADPVWNFKLYRGDEFLGRFGDRDAAIWYLFNSHPDLAAEWQTPPNRTE
jgi:hypothetical protein